MDWWLLIVLPLVSAGLTQGAATWRAHRHTQRLERADRLRAKRGEREDSQQFILDSAKLTQAQLLELLRESRNNYEHALREIHRLREDVITQRQEIQELRAERSKDRRENERLRFHVDHLQRVLLSDYGRRVPSIPAPPPENGDGNGGHE